jgi:acyl-coenzyme A synthetase/AMP-(fatty) acid ligase
LYEKDEGQKLSKTNMILYSSALTDRIFQNLQNIGGNIITSHLGKSITSHHFSEEIILFAKNLSLYGIKKGDRVGIFITDTILFSEIILATILC